MYVGLTERLEFQALCLGHKHVTNLNPRLWYKLSITLPPRQGFTEMYFQKLLRHCFMKSNTQLEGRMIRRWSGSLWIRTDIECSCLENMLGRPLRPWDPRAALCIRIRHQILLLSLLMMDWDVYRGKWGTSQVDSGRFVIVVPNWNHIPTILFFRTRFLWELERGSRGTAAVILPLRRPRGCGFCSVACLSAPGIAANSSRVLTFPQLLPSLLFLCFQCVAQVPAEHSSSSPN